MRQVELMEIAANMRPGECLSLTRSDMLGCADGMLVSAFDGPPRQADIDEFIRLSSESWGVAFSHDLLRDLWTMRKGRPAEVEFRENFGKISGKNPLMAE